MDRPAAVKLIRDTLENSFDKGSFINLSKNLFKHLDVSVNFLLAGNRLPNAGAFQPYIDSIERIGKSDAQSKSEDQIDVLIVNLKKETSLERARTRQRNFVARYLEDKQRTAALVAFVPPNLVNWRFSLVRMDYNIVESPSGRVKVETELTPARRYSFLVGENESSHTAQVQLLPILENDERKPLLSDFEKVFSIEVVTREFFTKYRDLFNDVKDALEDVLNQNPKAREDFEAKNVDPVNFAKKLLGQVVFLYFLQKKGWFGVSRDEDWGTGPKDFLRCLFEKKVVPYGNFFNDVLEPLFYEALALKRADDFYSRFNCKIPFLNGGLFDPINNYDWVHTDILLANGLFSNTERTKEGDIGIGILDVFDRYNFTVKEDEPLDKEVAVDPEMLGKVFENLLEVKDRKSKGTYYTPREIVHYMCQESLINYLDTAINTGEVPLVATPPPQGKLFGKPDPEQGALKAPGYRAVVPRENIEALVRMGELAIEHDTRVEAYGKETERYSYKLPESIRWNARLIDDKLASIRVCDPAIGSGAFPVGLMTEIVRARNTLTTYLSDKEGRTNYHFKRHAIQNCLYGVDIDPGAVEIAKLRLWLSLVVDEEDIKQIQPLPNLDYKIMQGDSLIEDFHGISLAFGENGQGRPKMFEEDSELLRLVENLHRQQDNLFDATHSSEKEQQKAEVENAIVDVFHHELKRQRATYFQFLENIERRACQIPNVEDRHKYYKAEKATLDNKSGFDFEALERELREMTHGNKVRPFFPWKLYFANVFREKGGFDVVIANPPYLGEKGHKETFREIKKGNLGKFYQGKMDLFYFFLHLALNLGKQNSNVAFITTGYYPTATGAKKLRQDFRERAVIKNLINFNELKIFESALGQHNMITILEKAHNENAIAKTCITQRQGTATSEMLQLILNGNDTEACYRKIAQKDLYDGDEYYIRTTGSPETLKDPIQMILDKVKKQGVNLGTIHNVNQGIVTGADKVSQKHIDKYDIRAKIGDGIFVLSDEEVNDLKLTVKEKEILKPWFKNSDIKQYYTKTITNEYLIDFNFTSRPKIQEYPVIGKHLIRFKRMLENRPTPGTLVSAFSKGYWWVLTTSRQQDFCGPKIVAPQRSPQNTFGYNEIPWYAASDVFFVTEDEKSISLKYILALINSKLYYLWLYHRGKRKGETLELIAKPLSEIPIKKISKPQQQPFIVIVDKILAITKDEDYLANAAKQAKVKELEREIDQMVYELYGLTPEEIAVVEGSR